MLQNILQTRSHILTVSRIKIKNEPSIYFANGYYILAKSPSHTNLALGAWDGG